MKRLVALMMCAVSLGAAGQSLNPFNPDSDNNGLIGASDLQSFLALYGLAWDADTLNVARLSEIEGYGCCPWRVPLPNDCHVLYSDSLPIDFGGGVELELPLTPLIHQVLLIGCQVSSSLNNLEVNVTDYYRRAELIFFFDGKWYTY